MQKIQFSKIKLCWIKDKVKNKNQILFFITCVFIELTSAFSQTLNWSSATRSGNTFTGTGINAVVISNGVTFGDGTPRTDAGSSNSACYISPSSLALYAGFFNSYTSSSNSHITTTFNFSNDYGCSEVSIVIKDINSDENYNTFCDVLELSATYNNAGTALPVSNIVTTLASNVNRSTSGNIVKLVGHNSSTETSLATNSYTSGTACANTTVKFTPPSGSPLKTITIKYRPAYGTSSSNAYYNLGTRPGAQYVSFGNLSFVSTAGCTPLPIELASFSATRNNKVIDLKWNTLTEKNNDYFTVERSFDGIKYEELSKIKGAGNSYSELQYETIDENPFSGITYYRLKQTDYNNDFNYFDPIIVDAEKSDISVYNFVYDQNLNDLSFEFKSTENTEVQFEIIDLAGRILLTKNEYIYTEFSKFKLHLNDLSNGIYFLKTNYGKKKLVMMNKIIIN